jgi:hypothetical protein
MEELGVAEDVLLELVTVAKDRMVGRLPEVLSGFDVKVRLFDLNLKGDQSLL